VDGEVLFPYLFQPLTIGAIEVRNRILSSAHQTGLKSCAWRAWTCLPSCLARRQWMASWPRCVAAFRRWSRWATAWLRAGWRSR
jgi:hypothetical protein